MCLRQSRSKLSPCCSSRTKVAQPQRQLRKGGELGSPPFLCPHRLTALLLALCLSLTACVSPGPATDVRSELVQEVRSLLDRRADALSNKDLDAYLAPLSPEARDLESRLAEGSTAVPIEGFSFSLQLSSLQSSQLPVSGVQVTLDYRYAGLPADNVFRVPLIYSIQRRGSELVITESAPGSGGLPIWASRPVTVASSRHFVALSSAGTRDSAGILDVAERARVEVEQAVPFPLDEKFLVVLAQSDTEYQQYLPTGGLGAGPRVAQASTSFQATPDGIRVEGRYMVVNLAGLARERTGLQTFKHELGHLALAKVTMPITPGWVAESAAMYLAGQKTNWTQRVATGNFEDLSFAELSRTRSLGEQDPTGQTAAVQYSYAAGAAGYLTETFGADKYWAFYRSYAEVPPGQLYRSLPSGGSVEETDSLADLASSTTRAGLQQFFGLTEAELDEEVRDWMRRNP